MEKYTEIIKRGWLKGLTIFHNSIDLNLDNKDLDQPTHYGIYFIKIGRKKVILVKYIGKAVIYYNPDGSTSYKTRFLAHREDLLAQLIYKFGPKNCQIYTKEGLTENQAKAAEAFFIQLIDGSTMSYGQKRWEGENFLNKRCEDINRTLIEYYNLDGNNDIEALRRQINDN